MKNFSITTKKGDKGYTTLLDDSKVPKYDLRPEVYGTIDEANAYIGLIKTYLTAKDKINDLIHVQNHLYLINAEISCPPEFLTKLEKKLQKNNLEMLEKITQRIEGKIKLPRKFVLYGQTRTSAYLDIARAIIRRAERRATELDKTQPFQNPLIIAYLNRLSDFMFLMARLEEYEKKVPYAHPTV